MESCNYTGLAVKVTLSLFLNEGSWKHLLMWSQHVTALCDESSDESSDE